MELKKISKISISDAKIVKQNRGMELKQFIKFKLFWIALSLFCHIFSENKCMRFTKSSHQYGPSRGKKS